MEQEIDIAVGPLPFGGYAFEPLSAKGKAWAESVVERNPDYPLFRAPDGCMMAA